MRVYNNVLELIGKTPLVGLSSMNFGLKPRIYAKIESFNPGGSIKDRIAVKMIDEAEKRGDLSPGGTIIEGTSGNTGLGLAMVAAIRGYRAIFTMPDKMSQEKIDLLKAFGAEVIVCPTAVEPDNPQSYYSVAQRLSEENPNSYYPNQYVNLDNPQTHYETTGPEIWEDTEGKVDVVVGGLGTGGTISGIGRYLKEQNPAVKIVGADPIGSLYTDYFRTGKLGEAHTYKVEGIGEDIIPETIDFSVIDEVIPVPDKDCFMTARALARREAIFTGGSGGAAMAAALTYAASRDDECVLVVLLPDTGERYLSKVFNDEWMRDNEFLGPRSSLRAEEILASKANADSEPLISIQSDANCQEALATMKEFEVSQIPVMESEGIVGRIQEDTLIDLLISGQEAEQVTVGSVMGEPLPIVSSETSVEEISHLLTSGNSAVLVARGGDPDGIITKYDLIQSLKVR